MEQDMDSRRGQRCVRSSKGVRAKQFARSIQKRTTRECVQTWTRTGIFTSWIAVEIAFTRATHQRVAQIVGMRIFYCKVYCPNIRQFDKPTWRENFGLADILRMMAAIYADNLTR